MRKHNMKSVTATVVALTIAASTVTPAFAEEFDTPVYAEEFVTEDTLVYTEEAPVYTEEAAAPVEEFEAAPVAEESPIYAEEAFVGEPVFAPIEEVAPVEEAAPVEETALIEEVASVEEAAPVEEETVPVEETAPVEETTPVEETAPVEEAPALIDADAPLTEAPVEFAMEEITVTDQLVVLDTGMIEMMDAVAAAEEMPMTEEDVKKILEETEGTKTEDEEDIHTPEEKEAKKNSWNDIEKVTRETITQGFWVLTSMVPNVGGVAVGRMGIPVLQNVFDLMTGVQSGPSISDVCKQIGSLSAQLDESTQKIKDYTALNSTLTEYGKRVDTIKSSVKQILNVCEGNADERLNDNERLVFLAQAMGKVGEGSSDTFLSNLDMVTQALTGTSSVNQDNLDLFQAAYKANKDKYMFSGEVMDAADGFISECLNNYIFCYSVAMNCLDAYRQVLSFTEDDVNTLGTSARNAYNNINTISAGTVCSTMKTLAEGITGKSDAKKGTSDTIKVKGVAQHYADYNATDRFIFVNKGKANVHLNQTIVAVEAKESSSDDDLNNALNSNVLSAKDVEDLVDYINNEWKGGTIQTYLKERGFEFALATEESREAFKSAVMAIYEIGAKNSGSSFDREKKAEEIDANFEAAYGPEAAKEIMKHTTYLAAGKQTMFTTSEHRTKSYSTITKEYYRGYNIRTNGAARKDVLHYTSSGSNHYRTNTFLVFQSK